MKTNKGISLITLVITIVVMIILAGVIILTLSSNGIIGKANEAVEKTNIRQIESLATMLWAEAYETSDGSQVALYAAVMKGLSNNGITPDKYDGYRIDVTESGVKVVKLDTSSDDQPSGNLPTSSDDQPAGDPLNHAGTIPTGGTYKVYVSTDNWAEYVSGQSFPVNVCSGDTYYYGDYIYYADYDWNNSLYTWRVVLNTAVVSKSTATTFGDVLESINGVPVVNISSTFEDCTALVTAPRISTSITNMTKAFYNCVALSSVQYSGTTEQWSSINKSEWWAGSSITQVICSNGTIVVGGQPAEDPLNHAGTIPTGGTYRCYSASPDYTTLRAGESFPTRIYSGDWYEYGDYRYLAEYDWEKSGYTWKVALNTSVIDKATATTFGEILESINGTPVTILSQTFKDCTALTTVPTIPSTITNMSYAFQNCTSLGSVFQYNGTVEEWERENFVKTGWCDGTSITTVNCTNKQGVCAVHNGLPTSSSSYTQITCPTCGTEYWAISPY